MNVNRDLSSLCIEKHDLELALDPIVDKLLTPTGDHEYVQDALYSFIDNFDTKEEDEEKAELKDFVTENRATIQAAVDARGGLATALTSLHFSQ